MMGRRFSQGAGLARPPDNQPPNPPAAVALTRHHAALRKHTANAEMADARHASNVTVALEARPPGPLRIGFRRPLPPIPKTISNPAARCPHIIDDFTSLLS